MTRILRTALAFAALALAPAVLTAQSSNGTMNVEGTVTTVREFTTYLNGQLGTITPGQAKTVAIGASTGSARADIQFNAATTVYMGANSTTLGTGTGAATVTMNCAVSGYQDYVTLTPMTSCTTPFSFPAPDGMTQQSIHIGFDLSATETAKMKAGAHIGDMRVWVNAGT